METKAENPILLLKDQQVDPIIEAYFELCQLKQLYRQGWLRGGMSRERCESVAEHSFACAVLAGWLAQAYYPDLDVCKVLRLALLHDFGEIYAGDVTPAEAVEPEEKHQREAGSVTQVFGKLPGGAAWLSLWEEFERNETVEARFVRQIDRLEMGLQAGVYALQGLVEPDEFFASARLALENPALSGLMEEMEKLRS
jgi:5'-deoxynucleotidase YfbR-like HD superfamily hydrolase